jgi:hypothetical protein
MGCLADAHFQVQFVHLPPQIIASIAIEISTVTKLTGGRGVWKGGMGIYIPR